MEDKIETRAFLIMLRMRSTQQIMGCPYALRRDREGEGGGVDGGRGGDGDCFFFGRTGQSTIHQSRKAVTVCVDLTVCDCLHLAS